MRLLIDRLLARLDTTDPDACWIWTGYTNPNGYGRIQLGATTLLYAHRVAYEQFVGPIPDGMEVDHLCRNRTCCNPAHLEAVTPAENLRRSNAVSAVNARKTHCIRGHEFTPENTRLEGGGRHRRCRACQRATARQRQITRSAVEAYKSGAAA